MTRRDLLAAALAVPLVRAASTKIPIGITDWNLRLSANPEAIPLAARLGFDGIQISCGRRLVDDKMPLDNPEVIARCLALSSQHKTSDRKPFPSPPGSASTVSRSPAAAASWTIRCRWIIPR